MCFSFMFSSIIWKVKNVSLQKDDLVFRIEKIESLTLRLSGFNELDQILFFYHQLIKFWRLLLFIFGNKLIKIYLWKMYCIMSRIYTFFLISSYPVRINFILVRPCKKFSTFHPLKLLNLGVPNRYDPNA